jgi:hypothetical protein
MQQEKYVGYLGQIMDFVFRRLQFDEFLEFWHGFMKCM